MQLNPGPISEATEIPTTNHVEPTRLNSLLIDRTNTNDTSQTFGPNPKNTSTPERSKKTKRNTLNTILINNNIVESITKTTQLKHPIKNNHPVNWSKQQITNNRTASKHNTLLENINEFVLHNMMNNPTRIDSGNIIYLTLTANPSVTLNIHTTPGMSDPEAVAFNINLNHVRNIKYSNINLYTGINLRYKI